MDEKLPPQTIKDKFVTGTLDSLDYSAFIFVAIQAGVAEARNATPEFHHGAAGYGRYYWHTYADYVDENLWVEFLLPTVLHQDSRYYTLGRGGFAKRLGYSLSRAAITRKDNGHATFNASEIFGAGAAAGISSLYYPSQERTFTNTYQLWLTNIAIDAGSNLFKEFWPDINNRDLPSEGMRDSIDWSIVSQIQGAVISSRNVGTACRGRLTAQSSNFRPARDRRAAAHLPQCLKWRDVCAGLRAQFASRRRMTSLRVKKAVLYCESRPVRKRSIATSLSAFQNKKLGSFSPH